MSGTGPLLSLNLKSAVLIPHPKWALPTVPPTHAIALEHSVLANSYLHYSEFSVATNRQRFMSQFYRWTAAAMPERPIAHTLTLTGLTSEKPTDVSDVDHLRRAVGLHRMLQPIADTERERLSAEPPPTALSNSDTSEAVSDAADAILKQRMPLAPTPVHSHWLLNLTLQSIDLRRVPLRAQRVFWSAIGQCKQLQTLRLASVLRSLTAPPTAKRPPSAAAAALALTLEAEWRALSGADIKQPTPVLAAAAVSGSGTGNGTGTAAGGVAVADSDGLFDCLLELKHLRLIALYDASLYTVSTIVKFVATNPPALRELEFTTMPLPAGALRQLFESGLRTNTHLRSLRFDTSHLKPAAFPRLIQSPVCNRLTRLSISNNWLSLTEDDLARTVAALPNLRILRIDNASLIDAYEPVPTATEAIAIAAFELGPKSVRPAVPLCTDMNGHAIDTSSYSNYSAYVTAQRLRSRNTGLPLLSAAIAKHAALQSIELTAIGVRFWDRNKARTKAEEAKMAMQKAKQSASAMKAKAAANASADANLTAARLSTALGKPLKLSRFGKWQSRWDGTQVTRFRSNWGLLSVPNSVFWAALRSCSTLTSLDLSRSADIIFDSTPLIAMLFRRNSGAAAAHTCADDKSAPVSSASGSTSSTGLVKLRVSRFSESALIAFAAAIGKLTPASSALETLSMVGVSDPAPREVVDGLAANRSFTSVSIEFAYSSTGFRREDVIRIVNSHPRLRSFECSMAGASGNIKERFDMYNAEFKSQSLCVGRFHYEPVICVENILRFQRHALHWYRIAILIVGMRAFPDGAFLRLSIRHLIPSIIALVGMDVDVSGMGDMAPLFFAASAASARARFQPLAYHFYSRLLQRPGEDAL